MKSSNSFIYPKSANAVQHHDYNNQKKIREFRYDAQTIRNVNKVRKTTGLEE